MKRTSIRAAQKIAEPEPPGPLSAYVEFKLPERNLVRVGDFLRMHVDQPKPTTLIAHGRHLFPQWGTALLILAIGTLFLYASALAYRS